MYDISSLFSSRFVLFRGTFHLVQAFPELFGLMAAGRSTAVFSRVFNTSSWGPDDTLWPWKKASPVSNDSVGTYIQQFHERII